MNWLDTQTQELLRKEDPLKLAPPKTPDFALVLLRKGTDALRLCRAIGRINNCDESEASTLADRIPPLAINRDLSYADALLGQFELVCCDAAAAFMASEVLGCGDRGYLKSLFEKISASPEFQPVGITIVQIPRNRAGQKFADQFMGVPEGMLSRLSLPLELTIPFKKARIMKHWAGRIGAGLDCDAI